MPSEDIKQVLNDAYGKIQSLIDQDQLLEAHRACLEVLQFDPDNIRVIRFKNKIERRVKNINIDAIKEDLKNLQPLWNEKKYEEYLVHLKELEPYIGDYPSLKNIILKAQAAYQRAVKVKQEAYYRSEMEEIKKQIQEQKFPEAVRAAEKLRILNLHDKEIKGLIGKMKQEWIESELKKNKALLESKKYEDILLFYQNLLRIDGKSIKLKKLIQRTKDKYTVYRIEEKRDLLYKELEKMKTFYQLQKFQRTIETARGILNIDPKNREARLFYRKAKHKALRSTDRELMVQMKAAQKQMKEEYKQDKKTFVRI